MDAEAQAGRRELLDLAVEALELALERLPAVDEQEHVRERAGAARGGHRLVAGLAERLLAILDLGAQLAHDARHRLAVELAGDAADVRARRSSAFEQAAAEVDRRRSAPAPGCGARSAPPPACAAACSCRCAASRRPRRGRPRRRGRASNGSVRCSAGRSSRPTHARSPSARSPPRHHGASVSTASSGSAVRQRRDPHLVHRRPVAGQAVDEHLQLARAAGRRRRRRRRRAALVAASNTRTGRWRCDRIAAACCGPDASAARNCT